ncbi:MAG: RNA polymerase sigma-70 factor [Niabella sp.]
MDHSEEIIIIQQLKEGSENAYRYLYDTYFASLCHTANRYLKDHYQSEVIVGDVIFHIWEIRESLQIEISLLSYLIGAVRNRCINHLSLSHIKYEVPVSFLTQGSDFEIDVLDYSIAKDNVPNSLLEKELGEKIKQAISALPPECRTVFEKSRFENKKYEDISQELSISVNTVKYHIKSALRFLRERLEKYVVIIFFFF